MRRLVVIVEGPDTGRSFNLAEGQTLVVGRGQASDTQINDPHVSRIHCHIQADVDQTWVIDVGSSSGTAVNGQPVARHELKPGDVIHVGDSKLRYQLQADDEGSTLDGRRFGQPQGQPSVVPLHELVGRSLMHFHLDEILATGQTGLVFKATDRLHNRLVAIKILSPEYTADAEQRERFVRAMRTMLPILHPHIVCLYQAGVHEPYCWAAMEYVHGESLKSVIDRIGVDGMLDWREVWRVAVDIGLALQKADEARIIHRNLTPTNILRQHADKVCLLGDLMLAKALEGTLAKQITRPGQLIGDVPYMSPERTRDNAAADWRSDLYGLGATLYALLTGHPPFASSALPELVRMIREEPPAEPRQFQLAVNELFQDLVLKMLAKRPEDRHQTPQELLQDLERVGRYANLAIERE